jgi:hypothetical protein
MERNDAMDLLKVGSVNSATLGVVTMADAESTLKVGLLALTIIYTLYKFFITWKTQKAQNE